MIDIKGASDKKECKSDTEAQIFNQIFSLFLGCTFSRLKVSTDISLRFTFSRSFILLEGTRSLEIFENYL